MLEKYKLQLKYIQTTEHLNSRLRLSIDKVKTVILVVETDRLKL